MESNEYSAFSLRPKFRKVLYKCRGRLQVVVGRLLDEQNRLGEVLEERESAGITGWGRNRREVETEWLFSIYLIIVSNQLLYCIKGYNWPITPLFLKFLCTL